MTGVKCTNNKTPDDRRRSAAAERAKRYGYTEREWNRISLREREEKRSSRKLALIIMILALVAFSLAYLLWYIVVRTHDFDLSLTYDRTSTVYGAPMDQTSSDTAASFASDLCVTNHDVSTDAITIGAYSAGLFNLNDRNVMYAKDIFTQRSEASLTKIMTALVAIKYGNLDDMVTVTDTAKNIEYGSSVCDIKTGDRLSLRQLVYGMMVASGNDAAMMIAEHVGGSVENFVAMMNEEANAVGATRTHFCNPHGLTDPDHYTCVYDLYLIFNAAMQYDVFNDIIGRENYYAEYTDINGSPVAVTWDSTDYYLTGAAEKPDNVIVYGGKTGTTDDAGACLALLSKDLYGNPYLSIILHSDSHEVLYPEMNTVLSLVQK